MKNLIEVKMIITMTSICIFLIGWNVTRAESSFWMPETLTQLIDQGLTHNNEIQSFEHQIMAAKEESQFVASLPDPKIGIGLLNLPYDSFRFDKEPMTQKQIFISQQFPWFGKLDLQSKQTDLKAQQIKAILTAKKLELARQIAVSYFDLGFIDKSLHTNARLTDLLNQAMQVAETRYVSGNGLQQDILMAQVELSKLKDEKITLDNKRVTAEDHISELLNSDSRVAVVTTADHLRYLDMNLDPVKLKEIALHNNPMLVAKNIEVRKSQIGIDLAQKDYWPNMDVKVAYGQRDHDKTGQNLSDFVSLSVMMNIPLWQKHRQDKKLAANQAMYHATQASFENLKKAIPLRVDSILNEILNTRDNYQLYVKDLIPKASDWAQSSTAAYEVGKIEFATMINAQVRVVKFELQTQMYLFKIYKNLAMLEQVLGSPLMSGASGSMK